MTDGRVDDDRIVLISVCWSPKGKQLVVATYDGALHCFDTSLTPKNQFPSPFVDQGFPPCVSVVWFSNSEYLLSFADHEPDDDQGDASFFQVLLTHEKVRFLCALSNATINTIVLQDQPPKTLVFYDLFYDADATTEHIISQYYHSRLNET